MELVRIKSGMFKSLNKNITQLRHEDHLICSDIPKKLSEILSINLQKSLNPTSIVRKMMPGHTLLQWFSASFPNQIASMMFAMEFDIQKGI